MTSEKNFVPLIKQALTNIMENRYPPVNRRISIKIIKLCALLSTYHPLLSAIHFQYRTNYLKNK